MYLNSMPSNCHQLGFGRVVEYTSPHLPSNRVGFVSSNGRTGSDKALATTFGPKLSFFVCFFLPFLEEAFKTCKNTMKLINLYALPCLRLFNTLLQLTLTVHSDLA